MTCYVVCLRDKRVNGTGGVTGRAKSRDARVAGLLIVDRRDERINGTSGITGRMYHARKQNTRSKLDEKALNYIYGQINNAKEDNNAGIVQRERALSDELRTTKAAGRKRMRGWHGLRNQLSVG